MSQQELLESLTKAFRENGVSYMLTGSVVSSFQGEPRLTHDIDVVVALEASQVAALAAVFPSPRFYLDASSAQQAILSESMFSVIDNVEGDTIDFWCLSSRAFDRACFARREEVDFQGLSVWMPRPEDTILIKLRWCDETGGLQKHFVDALRIYEVQAGLLDESYLDEWAERLETRPLLDRIRAESANPIEQSSEEGSES